LTELNLTLPLSATRAGYDPEQERARYAMNADLIRDKYHYEKMIGKRQSNGAAKLKELKPEHKQYISAFVNGMKGVEIAEQFNVAAITVYRVLDDPLAKAMIAEFDGAFKEDFQAMFPLVSGAIREGLESPSLGTKLKSVDRWAKIAAFLGGVDISSEEQNRPDVVAATRLRMVTMLQAAAEALPANSSAVIEVEAVVVETSTREGKTNGKEN